LTVPFLNIFFGVPHLATCIFLFFYKETELGVEIDHGMALTPLPSSIGRGSNPRPSDREPSALPLHHSFCFEFDSTWGFWNGAFSAFPKNIDGENFFKFLNKKFSSVLSPAIRNNPCQNFSFVEHMDVVVIFMKMTEIWFRPISSHPLKIGGEIKRVLSFMMVH